MGEGRGAGMCRYAGLSTTITMPPSGAYIMASTRQKLVWDGWDTWHSLAPVTRLELDCPPRTTEEALWVLHEVTYKAWLDLIGPHD